MRQTLAIFVDAQRAINARKLFWITLAISGFVVAAFGAVGITEEGLKFLWWQTPMPPTSQMMPPDVFYKTMFVSLGVKLWITWAAAILALVSTAGIIPDLVTDGAVDLVLSKPIGRVRLFLTKYASGLLFVGLQIGVFCLASFFVLGLRGGVWEPRVFLAVPVVVVFFSYLYSVCALLGLLTRSTIASLLLTLLFWFAIFGVHATESGLMYYKGVTEARVARLEQDIAAREAAMAAADAGGETTGLINGLRRAFEESGRRRALERRHEQLTEAGKSRERMAWVHSISLGVKTVLPKTAETVGLAERWLVDLSEMPEFDAPAPPPPPEIDANAGEPPPVEDDQLAEVAMRKVAERVRSRSLWWIVGTSLAFEAVVLGVACVLFVRRDF